MPPNIVKGIPKVQILTYTQNRLNCLVDRCDLQIPVHQLRNQDKSPEGQVHDVQCFQQYSNLTQISSVQLLSVILLLLAPVLTSCMYFILPVDCDDIYNNNNSQPSGVNTIYVTIRPTVVVQVHFIHCGTQIDL